MITFADKMKAQEEEAKKEGYAQQSGGGWYTIENGDNVIRVLTEPELFFEKFKTGICYTDCGYQGTAKFLTFVIDKKDGLVKLAKLPYSVGKQIADYQQDEDYKFEGFPMDYNIKIKATKAHTKEVEYTVVASPKREPVEASIMDELAKKGKVPEIIEKMKEKKKAEHIADGSFQREQDRKAKLKADLDEVRSSDADAGKPSKAIDYPEDEVNEADIPF